MISTTVFAEDIVNPKQDYTYEMMRQNIKALVKRYPDIITYKSLGKTDYNREIYAVRLGTGKANIFINASHHAREKITTNLVMDMLEYYAESYINKTILDYQFDTYQLLNHISIWFVPMGNPDGVTRRVFVPISFIAEIFHSTVHYYGNKKMVEIINRLDVIEMFIEDTIINENGVNTVMEVTPLIKDKSVLVPIRFVPENFGFDVSWDSEHYIVILKDNE